MSPERLFQVLSYTAVFCGFFSLWITGTFGLAGGSLFIGLMLLAWFLEGGRFQISERAGTALIVAALPVYYLLWRYRFFDFSSTEAALPGILARLILSLSAIKLLQRKSDRDWIFLYVMAFFQVLLAAGITISALYLASFVAYVFVMVCTIILFEIRKTRSQVEANLEPSGGGSLAEGAFLSARRLPAIAAVLITAIVAIAAPMFFLLPRVGGAGIGGGQGGVATSSGFSDTVRLGGIGRIQQNDEVVMRVRVEDKDAIQGTVRWRGIALDTFDNKAWRRSKAAMREVRERGDRDVIQVDHLTGREGLVRQTFYLEPLDSPVLFVLPRAVGVQGNFPILFKDVHGSISFQRTGERASYKVLSDIDVPRAETLRADREEYTREMENYLQLPRDLDPRIADLAAELTADIYNRYDAAHAIEQHLQTAFAYTLEQKASGEQPLADFLFNVREGHCEYFATAMAVMLRTQGIATRVVNGFQQGEYNETADVYVVRQREAHSWVEVYFPGEGVWAAFDPTPFVGQSGGGASAGFAGAVSKYLEALEMFWIQYFVAFDNQEQRSLFTSIRRGVNDYNTKASSWLNTFQSAIFEWWSRVRGDSGARASVSAIATGAGAILGSVVIVLAGFWAYRWMKCWKLWIRLMEKIFGKRRASVVEFYDRMLEILAARGHVRPSHQTPLEFARALGIPEVVSVTRFYNSVRFGSAVLSDQDVVSIESSLKAVDRMDR